MSGNIHICTFISNEALAATVHSICRARGWRLQSEDARSRPQQALAELPRQPDMVIFDQADDLTDWTAALTTHGAVQGIYIGEAAPESLPARVSWVHAAYVEDELVARITTVLNIMRFDAQFFSSRSAEPITRLPHHPELLAHMERYQGRRTGVLVVQVDHAEHLYANLDPVSKTDLLGALSEHLSRCLPHSAHMGIFDAASFVVWCPNASPGQMTDIAHCLAERSAEAVIFRGGQLHFSLSIGHAFETSLVDASDLWQRAWQAKEKAAKSGGNRIEAAHNDASLGERVPAAIDRDEFALVLQPQWDITGAQLHGVEALLRWQGMEVGKLAPDHFIPVVERSGQMARVGDWVLERASSESTTWLEHLVSPIWMGVNISPQQFVNDALNKQINRLAKEQWLDPAILELEMSHANLLHVVDQHRTALFELRDMGVRIAIDNLGTSVVDANKLLRCPADTLKIDRSLIASIEQDSGARQLTEQICRVADRFTLRTVAVGVETDEQRSILQDMGCTDAQGFLFAEPIPLPQFRSYLTEHAGPGVSKRSAPR